MAKYEPELGQYAFGQPYKEFAVPHLMVAALEYVRNDLSRVRWNIHQRTLSDPFGNEGASGDFDSGAFSVRAYSWGEEAQPWNFKCGELEISWYKYLGRGMSANMEISPDLVAAVLAKCLAHIRSLETH